MIQEVNFSDSKEFLEYNSKIIHNNYFAFYASISAMLSPQTETIYRLFNVFNENNAAYCLWYSGNYTIHSFKWNEEIIDKLSEEIEFEKYRNYAFSGQRDLILNLLKRNNVNYEIVKDRLIYECTSTTELQKINGTLELASTKDTEELSAMSYKYHLEEYGNDAQRSLEYMTDIIKSGIRNSNIYKLTDNGIICSLAQVISQDFGFPLIGQLYTKPELRGKGYGTSILFHLTNKLLSSEHLKCGLLSDMKKATSNKIFEKIGYKAIYKHILAYKKQ